MDKGKMPTIALCMIVKNEQHNLPRLFKSIAGLFDEVHITDTGSTDATPQVIDLWAVDQKNKYGTKVERHFFEWIHDFGAARNASFEFGKNCDYQMWLDADDTIENPEGFRAWRQNAMSLAQMWLANYDYAQDIKDQSVCSFSRERAISTKLPGKWAYFIHEGFMPSEPSKAQVSMTNGWFVKHHRKMEDLKQDKGRNLSIFSKHLDKLDHRMTFYYGKELFEAGDTRPSLKYLSAAAADPKLELHDKVLAMQFFSYAARTEANKLRPETAMNERTKLLVDAINMCHQGLILMPDRAEFYCSIGDCYLDMGAPMAALPNYAAAKFCLSAALPGQGVQSALYTFPMAYKEHPRLMLSRIYYNIGEFQKALDEAKDCFTLFGSKEAKEMITIIEDAIKVSIIPEANEAVKTDDIVITCPPQGMYSWDEEIAKRKGMGGSETACIEMAKNLHKLTGRKVKVFNIRDSDLVAESGVEYISNKKLNKYFSENIPKVHIAWRHNLNVTKAPTYAWCHDLVLPGVERGLNADKFLALTEFHKNFTIAMSGLDPNKILVTRNGVVSERFATKKEKKPFKFVFPSSPDRGLDRAMKVLDIVRAKYPEIELHVFYGFENLYKSGLTEKAMMMEEMIKERPWVKFHGFTQQDELIEHFKEAAYWLHPCDFIETSCITAIEMLCAGVYPITRRLGGLQNTLEKAESEGMAVMLPHDCITLDEFNAYADATIEAMDCEAYKRVSVDPKQFDWSAVAKEWVEMMDLK